MRIARQILLASCLALVAFRGEALAEQDGASAKWVNLRLALWESACLKPVMQRKSFASAARKAGFSANPEGLYVYKKTEIVASVSKSGPTCKCDFSFGTSIPDEVATKLIQRTVKSLGSKFEPDDDPQSIGVVHANGQKAQLIVVKFKHDGVMWVGASIKGPATCAIMQ